MFRKFSCMVEQGTLCSGYTLSDLRDLAGFKICISKYCMLEFEKFLLEAGHET